MEFSPMLLRRILTMCVFAMVLGAVPSAFAQTYIPTTSKPSWNTYVASVIPDAFVTIIGNGGTMIPNTNNTTQNNTADWMTLMPLPFNFVFMNKQYNTGDYVNI